MQDELDPASKPPDELPVVHSKENAMISESKPALVYARINTSQPSTDLDLLSQFFRCRE